VPECHTLEESEVHPPAWSSSFRAHPRSCHGTYRYAFSVEKAERTKKRGWDEGEKEKERDWEKEESTMSTHAWQKIDASCALTPRGSFRVTWYRPVERSNGRTVGRATRILVNVLSGGSWSLFFNHLFLLRSVVCVYHMLYLVCSRIRLRVSRVTALSACTFTSATASLDRTSTTSSIGIVCVAYHVSHILIQKTLMHTP